jgi:ribosomal-protein-alanine N-acetyltransferase
MVIGASSCVTSRIAAADLEAARDVLQAAFAEQGHDTARDLDQLREEFARPWSRLWVARGEADAPIVAVLLAWHIVDELEILDVATHPDHRRLGYARALVAGAVAFAAEHAVARVLLEARRSNAAAIALYRGAGFYVSGLRRRYYPDDEDAVLMTLALDPQTRQIVHLADEEAL